MIKLFSLPHTCGHYMTFPFKAIDLTHTISSTTPTWEGDCGFQHQTILDYADCTTPVKFKVQKINMFAGLGTHIDAPAHCIQGKLLTN